MLGHRAGIHRYMRTKNCLHPIWPAWIKTRYQQQQKQQKAYKFIGIKQYLLNKKMDPDRNQETENFLEFSDNKYTAYPMSCGHVCEAIFKLIIDIRRPRLLWVMQIWVGRMSLYKKTSCTIQWEDSSKQHSSEASASFYSSRFLQVLFCFSSATDCISGFIMWNKPFLPLIALP